MAIALDNIHKCEFAHNDLKCNNVVLEKHEDLLYVAVTFGQDYLGTLCLPLSLRHALFLYRK